MCSDKIVMIQEMEKDREAWHAAVHGIAKSLVVHIFPSPSRSYLCPFLPALCLGI